MKAWLLFLFCVAIAGCNKPPAAEAPRNENSTSKDAVPKDISSKETASKDTVPKTDAKPGEVLFDLLKDTAHVREALAGAWYQVDHSRDGSTTSLSVVWMFADGTARDEYWTLIHKERIASYGTDQGRWKLRGDTIAFHFEGKPSAAASAPQKPSATAPSTTPPSTTEPPPAAAAPPTPAPAVADESDKPRDDEQRILQATKDWFTYEYRTAVSSPPAGTEPPSVIEGVSVRVANDFKLPRSISGYRTEGKEAEPPGILEKLIKKISR